MADENSEREPTLPPETAVHIRGWDPADADVARLFGERVLALTHEYSRWLDLSRLSKIIIPADYRAAVAEIEGADGHPHQVTSNEYGEGAAIALPTIEEAILKSVVVVSPPLIERLFDAGDSLEKQAALQTYVHELVHVDDQAFLEKTFPGGAAAAIQSDERHGALLLMVGPAQSEYSATSRTAMIEPSTGFDWVALLERTLSDVGADVRRQRQLYRVRTIDLETFWPWVQERCRFIFQALGYALGHADAVLRSDKTSEELKSEYRRALERIEAMEMGWLVEETRTAVLPIVQQPAWTGLDIFDALIEVGERLLNSFGIHTNLRDGTLYVDVPLTRWRDF